MGKSDEFKSAVNKLIQSNLTAFSQLNTKVQVFESNIRVLGGLLSAHIFASRPDLNCHIEDYGNELLSLAYSLGKRLMPAFETSTGIPHPRINFTSGVPLGETLNTCSAGGGSLILEFATLSRLSGDNSFERVAKRAFYAIWSRRTPLGLVGNTINVITGLWQSHTTGIGAGVDSFYEYALKAYVLLGEEEYYQVFASAYNSIQKSLLDERGWTYRNVHLGNGAVMNSWVDSLTAFWPGVQVLWGDLEGAIRTHLFFWSIWMKNGFLPERWDFIAKKIELPYYPLRPELIESTYFLYRATRDPFYLHVGEYILKCFQDYAFTPCGWASIGDVKSKIKEDRMESFVLSESFKYLYLLFTEEHVLHDRLSNTVFSTEGHILQVDQKANPSVSYEDLGVCKAPPTRPNNSLELSSIVNRPDFFHVSFLTDTKVLTPEMEILIDSNGTSAPMLIVEEFEINFSRHGNGEETYISAEMETELVGRREGGQIVIAGLFGMHVRFAKLQNGSIIALRVGKSYTVSSEETVVIEDAMAIRYVQSIAKVATPIMSIDPLPATDAEMTYGSVWISLDNSAPIEGFLAFEQNMNFGQEIFMVQNVVSNLYGCNETIIPKAMEEGRSCLVIKRGKCSFFEKASNAKMAGYDVVLVLDDQNKDKVRPSLDDSAAMESVSETLAKVILVQGEQEIQAIKKGSQVEIKQKVLTNRILKLGNSIVANVIVH